MRDKCARLARTCEKPGSQWSQSVPSRGRCAAPGASSRSLLCATSAYSVSLWCVFAASFSPQRHRVQRLHREPSHPPATALLTDSEPPRSWLKCRICFNPSYKSRSVDHQVEPAIDDPSDALYQTVDDLLCHRDGCYHCFLPSH